MARCLVGLQTGGAPGLERVVEGMLRSAPTHSAYGAGTADVAVAWMNSGAAA